MTMVTYPSLYEADLGLSSNVLMPVLDNKSSIFFSKFLGLELDHSLPEAQFHNSPGRGNKAPATLREIVTCNVPKIGEASQFPFASLGLCVIHTDPLSFYRR